MDSQYGIAVTNKFCLFDDDDDVDPYEILKQEEQKRNEALAKEKTDKSKAVKKTKKSAPQPDKSKPSEQNTQKREEKTVSQSQSRPQQNDRPPRSARMNRDNNREPREDRRPRRFEDNNSYNTPTSNDSRDKPEGGFGGRMEGRGGFSGRSRGRGGPRGRGRGGFGGGFGGKREFERHSGSDRTSGVKSTEKREGGGSHNWGTFKDDIDEEGQGSKENEKPEDWNQGGEDTENQDPNESTESTEQPVSEGDKAPKQLSFDEWKAQEEKKRLKADFNLRKANEGSDTAQWNKGYVYKKPANETDDEEDDEEYEEEDEQKSKSQVPIRITFNDSPRRGGRGGRGRPRGTGRGPRGMPGRGDRRGGPRDSAPRFDDESDFPSLVKSAA